MDGYANGSVEPNSGQEGYFNQISRDVLDHGKVVCRSWFGGDLAVVNAARVSFGKTKEILDESDVGLIGFLMKNHHGTPFEHATFTFAVKSPISVSREWFRHRWGSFSWVPSEESLESYNEYSLRYSAPIRDMYTPRIDDIRSQKGKPGSYTFEQVDPKRAYDVICWMDYAYEAALKAYDEMIALGVAKELARNVLPLGSYTQFYWTVNARALMHFLSLRSAPTAMLEIREYAKAIDEIFGLLMPVTYNAYKEHGGIAP